MASDLFGKANDEFINENFQKALELYTEALLVDKSRDDIYCNRAQAHIKLDKFKEAVQDAQDAIAINPTNVKAVLRKGIALFHLEDYKSAKKTLVEGQKLDGDDKNFSLWIRKCDAELDLSNKSDSNVGVASSTNSEQSSNQSTPSNVQPEQTSTPQSTPSSVPMPPKEKSRYDWYQTPTHVVVTIMLKNVKQEDAKINIQEKSLSATIKLPTGSDYCLDLDLSHSINPEQSTIKIMKTKIEVKLKKMEGIQWKRLEGEEPTNIKQIDVGAVVTQYPSSSHYTRNWDKLATDITKEEKEEKKEGDAALNDLFQKIYADGSSEQKKAMMKSFYESGGTVLSTNWDEIGNKKTEVKPPDGMEFKKWES